MFLGCAFLFYEYVFTPYKEGNRAKAFIEKIKDKTPKGDLSCWTNNNKNINLVFNPTKKEIRVAIDSEIHVLKYREEIKEGLERSYTYRYFQDYGIEYHPLRGLFKTNYYDLIDLNSCSKSEPIEVSEEEFNRLLQKQ